MIGGVSGIVLAAGSSSRLGQPKQLLDYRGKPLLQHAIDAMEGAGLLDIVVVVGHRSDEVRRAVTIGPETRIVENPDYAEGQATSLAVGLDAADASSAAAVIILGDQPGMDKVMVRSVIKTYQTTKTKSYKQTSKGGPITRRCSKGRCGPTCRRLRGTRVPATCCASTRNG